MLTATADSANTKAEAGATSSWRQRALAPVPADSAAAFRIFFGLLVTYSAVRFLAKGWVTSLYLEPEYHLTYAGFEWVRPLPAPWMHLHVAGIAALGICIALGYRHRLSTGLFILAFGYTELIEASLYLNHYWFLTVTAVLLLLLPVDRQWSLDARRGRIPSSDVVPAVVVWLLRAQLGAVYVFAGLAKLNPDWLFRAQPLQLWLADRTDTPVVGLLFDQPAAAYLASWTAVLFDVTIVGWLLYRPTRKWAYLSLVVFHLATGALFQIGVFPWVMILTTLVFFEPDWPTRFGTNPTSRPANAPTPFIGRAATVALVLFTAVQLVLPLRHYAYASDVRWSEEGYYLSWRVMLTDKAGHTTYHVTNPATGESWEVGPELVLTDWQQSHAATRPDLIHATALLIAGHYQTSGIPNVEVRADAWVSMNATIAERIIDPRVDLVAEPRDHAPSPWILSSTSLND